MKNETHKYDNVNDDTDEKELYELDKLSLDDKRWRTHEFEGKVNNIHDMKSLNSMNDIHN